MKKLLLILMLLSVFSAHSYDCDLKLSENTQMFQEIVEMIDISEEKRSLLLELSANERKSIELACGLKDASRVDLLSAIEQKRVNVLNMTDISEEQRSLMLEIISNTIEMLEQAYR